MQIRGSQALKKSGFSKKQSYFAMATWGHRRPPPGPLDCPVMILGHYGLARAARHRVWSSGAAHAAPGGRRGRLLDLKARRSDVEQITRGADLVVKIFENFKNHQFLKCFVWYQNWTGWTLGEYNSRCGCVCDGSKYKNSFFELF